MVSHKHTAEIDDDNAGQHSNKSQANPGRMLDDSISSLYFFLLIALQSSHFVPTLITPKMREAIAPDKDESANAPCS